MQKAIFHLIAVLGLQLTGPAHAQLKLKDLNYHVTQSGWRNLRFIRHEIMEETTEIWYVCGQRKLMWLPLQKPFDHSTFELVNARENKEFWSGDPTLVFTLDEFLSNEIDLAARRINKAEFTAKLAASCSTAPKTVRVPPPMNAGYSGVEKSTFYYILPTGFNASGSKRTFWISHHGARSTQYKAGPDIDFREPVNGSDPGPPTLSGWLIKTDPSTMTKTVIDCDRNTVATLNYIRYNENGEVMNSHGNVRSSEIVPNSVAETWKEISCFIR